LAIVATFALVALVSASKRHRPTYDEWAKENGRTEKDEITRQRRKANYDGNLNKIDQLNVGRVDPDDAEYDVTSLADLTDDEFRATRLNNADFSSMLTEMKRTLPQLRISKRDIEGSPKSKDWRKSKPKVVGKVTDQKACGSCWAFASIGNIEGVTAVAGKKFKTLSEQELIDCARTKVNKGCNGGWQVHAFEYVKKHGVHTDSVYGKYTAKQNKCKKKGSNGMVKVRGYYTASKSAKSIMAAIAKYGPVTALVDADSWHHYKRGISKACAKKLNHAVLIVGYGNYHGKPVWIVRNSWGKRWGMNGYALVRRTSSKKKCDAGIKNGVSTAVAA